MDSILILNYKQDDQINESLLMVHSIEIMLPYFISDIRSEIGYYFAYDTDRIALHEKPKFKLFPSPSPELNNELHCDLIFFFLNVLFIWFDVTCGYPISFFLFVLPFILIDVICVRQKYRFSHPYHTNRMRSELPEKFASGIRVNEKSLDWRKMRFISIVILFLFSFLAPRIFKSWIIHPHE